MRIGKFTRAETDGDRSVSTGASRRPSGAVDDPLERADNGDIPARLLLGVIAMVTLVTSDYLLAPGGSAEQIVSGIKVMRASVGRGAAVGAAQAGPGPPAGAVHGAAVAAGPEGDLVFDAAACVVQARWHRRVRPSAAVTGVQGRPVAFPNRWAGQLRDRGLLLLAGLEAARCKRPFFRASAPDSSPEAGFCPSSPPIRTDGKRPVRRRRTASSGSGCGAYATSGTHCLCHPNPRRRSPLR